MGQGSGGGVSLARGSVEDHEPRLVSFQLQSRSSRLLKSQTFCRCSANPGGSKSSLLSPAAPTQPPPPLLLLHSRTVSTSWLLLTAPLGAAPITPQTWLRSDQSGRTATIPVLLSNRLTFPSNTSTLNNSAQVAPPVCVTV